MKSRGIYYLLAFLSFIVASGLACSALTGTPTPVPEPTRAAPTEAPVAVATEVSSTPAADTVSSEPVTFVDKNKYYQIDIPGDWKHTSNSGDHDYSDTFTSPDGAAVVENYTYDDGTSWTGKDTGKAALFLLNRYYSNTQQEGDIRVSEEKLQKDGSDRLTWTSKSGGYSGITFFELRGSTTFLMFTVWWNNDSKDQYFDTLNNVISSYDVPK